MDLTTQSPVQIDEQLFALQQQYWTAYDQQQQEMEYLHRKVGDEKVYPNGRWTTYWHWNMTSNQVLEMAVGVTSLDAYQGHVDAKNAAMDAMIPLQEEFNRRDGWTRCYLVDNADGHYHNTEHCSSFRIGTRYHWLTFLSGQDENEIVLMAGEKACTICYRSAPVLERALKQPTDPRLEGPAQRSAREEREAKAAARAAKDAEKITVEGLREFGRSYTKTFKSVRAVTNQIASDLSTLCWYGPDSGASDGHVINIELLRKALTDRGIAYDYDKALAAARKKANRDSSQGAQF